MEFTAASRPSVSISPSLVLDDSDNSSSNPQQGPMKGFSAADSSAAVSMEKSFQSIAVDVVPDFGGPNAVNSTPRNDKTTTHSFAAPTTRRTGPRMSMKIPATSKDSRKLFVGGLPMDVTSHEFLTFFLQFGNVLDSVVMFDRETRKPRGFGFVTFDDPEVCRRLLRMGQMDTLDEETTSEAATAHSSGRLEMRGKLIEVKAAQPKAPGAVSSSSTSNQPKAQPYYTSSQHYPATAASASDYASQSAKMLSHQAPEYHHNPGFGAKHPATLPHHHHHHHAKFPSALYGFSAPPTPGGAMFGADPSTPVTPQQAALDMAHHMMFYSQLLATPTLISPLISPMMSPMIMGFHDPNQFQQFSQHFQPYKAQQTMQQQQQQQQSPHSSPQPFYNSTNKSHMPPPTPATASKAPVVVTTAKGGLPSSTGTPFRIGGATFAFEEPESPTPEREEL